MKKELRQQVYNKFNGLCAYTGKPLDEKWQVDHMTPDQAWYNWERDKSVLQHIDNLMPAIRIINHYKRCRDLEQFREFISTMHIRLKRLPKNPYAKQSIKHKEYLLEVAEHFNISADKPFSGIFYFESL